MRLLVCLAVLAVALPATAQDRTPLPPGVDVMSREAWGGTLPTGPMVPQTPAALTIHHAGTPMRPDRAPEDILQALLAFSTSQDTLADGSVKRAWADIPYHFAITADGTILEARDVQFQGATNTVYDLSDQILVELDGNFEIEAPTEAQMASLLALSEALARQWGFGPATVAGHRDHAPGQTVCPGDSLVARFPDIRDAVARGARQSLSGAWVADLRSSPEADPDLLPLTLSVDALGRVTGTLGDAVISSGTVDAEWDALRFTFSVETADESIQTHGAVRGGRLEATSVGPNGTLIVWSAVRSE